MILDKLKTYAWQLAALALAVLLLLQTHRLTNAAKAEAKAAIALATHTAEVERELRELTDRYRTLEGNYRNDLLTIADTYASETRRFLDDADRANAARDSMRRDLAAYIESHRAAALNRAAAGQCTPDTAALDLLADLQRRADDRAGELALIADDARTRGAECASRYDSARALIEEARRAQTR
ncbi:DUF2514 family protein [Alicycliphilus denitrificans]|uniref:DUF2514 family protein n=1 Tax=Alicycliphilus denitrificans TaxID=179636 RepID=UPI0001D9FE9D|nr:DUF2514 family protein [Alicycliphilus denitrificans]ADU99036.1 Protein of unknown function DUF2514 [Alicycliphilus denitrificans BC]